MAQLTQEQARQFSELDRHNPIEFAVQKGGTTLWKNGVYVKYQGKAQLPQANVAGQTLLGFATCTYTTPSNSDYTWSQPQMIFQQGCGAMANDTNDPVVAADAGSDVFLTDDNTVHHTNAGNDVAVRCKWINPDGTIMCEVKNP
jgi:hypothetical protein